MFYDNSNELAHIADLRAQLEAVRKERDAAVALTDQAIHLGNDALANLQDEYATLQADPVALRTVLEQINVLDANVRTHEQTNSALGYRKALQDVRNAIGTMYALHWGLCIDARNRLDEQLAQRSDERDRLRSALETVKYELAALFPVPSNPTLGEAMTVCGNKNEADARCIYLAYVAARAALTPAAGGTRHG